MHRWSVTTIFVATLLALGTCSLARADDAASKARAAAAEPSWHSPSLTMETVTGPNGVVTTRLALEVDRRMGVPDEKVAEEVVPGVYALRGWGIAHSFAIEAPGGWIIVDTGDSTRAATEMREKLEAKVGKKIKVAAILLTHWHYADGTAAWLDPGAELWGHEHLDRNRRASTGVNVLAGTHMSRAIAQFGVLHPPSGPDAFPNLLGFTPEKFLAVSSYQPPAKLFEDGKVVDLVIAGEPVQVAPNRSDASDSVGFWFPRRRLLVTNFMVVPTIFNIYTLRGSPFRDPVTFIHDARWLESKNAELLLDIHGPDLKGEKAVREALEMSVDQVQLIHDQTLRLIARGMDGREAAENLYMPPYMRDDREGYGQVESHVRQVYNGNLGWFGRDVYEINPLSLREEAARTVGMMGGPAAVRKAAAAAARKGGLANWRWSLKLTSLLLRVDPADAGARKTRATAARALGQRTDSANARGFYITEALTLEGRMMADGRPVTLDEIRVFVGTPTRRAAGGGLRGREPGIRPLPRGSAQGRGEAAGVHDRRRGRSADPAGRAAQRRARDHRGGGEGRPARGGDAPRAGRLRPGEESGHRGGRPAGRARSLAGSQPPAPRGRPSASGARAQGQGEVPRGPGALMRQGWENAT